LGSQLAARNFLTGKVSRNSISLGTRKRKFLMLGFGEFVTTAKPTDTSPILPFLPIEMEVKYAPSLST
jgi:hypothetical protein